MRRGVLSLSTICATAAAALALAANPAASQGVRKPVPLPGVDPGGVMVAFVGRGIDYTRPGLSDRLARDGEGEIIGFDLVDRDRRPFCRVDCQALTDAAQAMLAAAPQSRLAVFKVDGAGLAAPALQMAVQAKAAIVVLDLPDDAQTAVLLRAASERFRDTLIILAPRPSEAAPAQPAAEAGQPAMSEKPGGDASVQAAAPPATPPTAPAATAAPVPRPDTVIVAANPPATSPPSGNAALAHGGPASRIAAEAVRIVAASPSTRGATLKAQVETQVEPAPGK
jgi:hypothetical protein